MTEYQIAVLDDDELAMHIRKVQLIADADHELTALLHERRRRQILTAIVETEDIDLVS